MEKLAEARAKSFSVPDDEKDYDYLIDAMQPIDEDFTKKTFEEGYRVWNQLEKNLSASYQSEFDFQGSVTSDTHIRIHSDIDLLALNGCFACLDQGAANPNPYRGDVTAELCAMRADAVAVLKSKFPEVKIDAKPGKAITLEGGSLARKIDVVVGNWWDTELWKEHNSKVARGIRIVDTKGPSLIKNKPFLHNYRIDERDKKTGGLRKAVRLLKTLKYDADSPLAMSSYDITAVAWNMTDAALTVAPNEYLELSKNTRDEIGRFIANENVRNALLVPNGTRKVFGDDGATLESLKELHRELVELINRIEIARLFSFSKTKSASYRKLPDWIERRPQVILEHSY